MMNREILRDEAAHYRALSAQLLESFSELDDETLKDTLQGLSHFPDMIEEIVRSSLEDEVLMVGLKARMADMASRLERFTDQNKRKRDLACWAMGAGGIDRLKCPDFSISYRMGGPRLEVTDEAKLPDRYLLAQPPRVDRVGLANALKGGVALEGAVLVAGQPHIQVRTR